MYLLIIPLLLHHHSSSPPHHYPWPRKSTFFKRFSIFLSLRATHTCSYIRMYLFAPQSSRPYYCPLPSKGDYPQSTTLLLKHKITNGRVGKILSYFLNIRTSFGPKRQALLCFRKYGSVALSRHFSFPHSTGKKRVVLLLVRCWLPTIT